MQVVATNKLEVDRLASLWERAQQNGVPDVQLLKGQNEIAKVEPHCKGLQALWSPHTGVQIWVNWGRESTRLIESNILTLFQKQIKAQTIFHKYSIREKG